MIPLRFDKNRGELLNRDKRYIEQYIIKAIGHYKSIESERGDSYDLDM